MITPEIKETLLHCPEGTLEALVDFRASGSVESLTTFVKGAMIRHLDPDQAASLETATPQSRFIDDLGIDSLTMTEIVIMIEECLDIAIPNEDLMELETLGGLHEYLTARAADVACNAATTA